MPFGPASRPSASISASTLAIEGASFAKRSRARDRTMWWLMEPRIATSKHLQKWPFQELTCPIRHDKSL